MQISTRNHDYIIDTLELRHLMYRLLDPFTDPRIVKVMHGADWDIPWLQRDFGLYVVNLFDTGVASHVLQLPKHSLAFLLQYCCGVEADKQYQLADWRIRPLPAEMEKYAREDTHYLLYIYDRMRNELIRRKRENQDPLRTTLSRSKDVCLKTYQKPTFREDSYLRLYYKHKRHFNSQQLHCLKLLYKWRDRVARDEDENTGYVLPNHMLFQIAEQLPREAQGVLACCTPVPPLLRQQLQEVFILVQEARETPPTQKLPKLRVPVETTPPTTPISTAIDAPQTQNTPHSEPVVTVVNPKPHLVQLTGPPVASAPTSMSAIERAVPEVSELVRQQLRKIQSSFPDILSQFMEPSSTSAPPLAVPPPMVTTAPVITPAKGQERGSAGCSGVEERETATPTDSCAPVSNIGTPNTTVPRHTTEGGGGAKTTANGGKTKKKRKVSARELGRGGKRRKVSPPEEGELRDEEEEEEGRGAGKKIIKLTEKDFKEDEFTPFSYGGVDFADYTKATPDPAHPPLVVFRPQSASGGKKGRGGARSKVIMRSGDKSLTHSDTTRHQTHSQRLWPKGN
ncbi:Exosome component 10 [Geodia barretti]|nr:Exosome component 10 [Geodia barretti]